MGFEPSTLCMLVLGITRAVTVLVLVALESVDPVRENINNNNYVSVRETRVIMLCQSNGGGRIVWIPRFIINKVSLCNFI